MISRMKSKQLKRLLKTAIPINPDVHQAAWSVGNGQGYARTRQGNLVKISDPMPEGYAENARKKRDRKVKAL